MALISYSQINPMDLSEYGSHRLYQANFLILKIKYGVVILQKLRTHYPVLLTLFAS